VHAGAVQPFNVFYTPGGIELQPCVMLVPGSIAHDAEAGIHANCSRCLVRAQVTDFLRGSEGLQCAGDLAGLAQFLVCWLKRTLHEVDVFSPLIRETLGVRHIDETGALIHCSGMG